jgi:hypothetical protein
VLVEINQILNNLALKLTDLSLKVVATKKTLEMAFEFLNFLLYLAVDRIYG